MVDINRFMNIGQFCKHVGISRWHFMRIVDRYHVPLRQRATSMLVEVEPTITLLATVPDIEWMLSDHGLEMVRQVRAAVTPEPQPAQQDECA